MDSIVTDEISQHNSPILSKSSGQDDGLSIEELTEQIAIKKIRLQEAVSVEDYEKASQIKMMIDGLKRTQEKFKEDPLLSKIDDPSPQDISNNKEEPRSNIFNEVDCSEDVSDGSPKAPGGSQIAPGGSQIAPGGSEEVNETEVTSPKALNSSDGIPLNERIMVKYKTADGSTNERKKKRSYEDEFYWSNDVDPRSEYVRLKFLRGHLSEHMYNWSIDTHTPVAITYIDPLTNKVHFSGTGECLDFIQIPEDRSVVWKAPNHPQSGMMSPDFCKNLPFNHVEKKQKTEVSSQQLKKPFKISDLRKPRSSVSTLKPTPDTSKTQDHAANQEPDALFHEVPEGDTSSSASGEKKLTPVFRKIRGGGGRGGGRAGRGGRGGEKGRGARGGGRGRGGKDHGGRGEVQGRGGRGGGEGRGARGGVKGRGARGGVKGRGGGHDVEAGQDLDSGKAVEAGQGLDSGKAVEAGKAMVVVEDGSTVAAVEGIAAAVEQENRSAKIKPVFKFFSPPIMPNKENIPLFSFGNSSVNSNNEP